jgi:hypothetical protein
MKNKNFLIYGALVVLAIPITLSLIAANKKKSSSSDSSNMSGYSNLSGNTSVCKRKNSDGSTTIYTGGYGDNPCPYGGKLSR